MTLEILYNTTNTRNCHKQNAVSGKANFEKTQKKTRTMRLGDDMADENHLLGFRMESC